MEKKIFYKHQEFDNVKGIILNTVEHFGNRTAFTIKHKKDKEVEYENITYNRFMEEINALGTQYYNMGFKGKRIAVIGKNRYEWVLAHVTNLLGGIVSVPLDKDLQLEELETSLVRSKADAIVFDEKLIDIIEAIKQRGNTNLKEYICMSKGYGYTNIRELIDIGSNIVKTGNREYIDCEIDNNAMNILLFTSGTTSQAKAVMLSQKNIASNIYALKCTEYLDENDVNIAFLPLHHIFGSTCIIWTLSYGLKHVFPDGLRYIKQNLCEYEVSVFVGVPILIESIYKAIMKEVEKQGKTKVIKIAMAVSNFLRKLHIDLRRTIFKSILGALGGKLRFVVSGGAPADPEIAKAFNDLGILTLQGYGLSETAPVIAGENEKQMRKGSVGHIMVNDEVEIVEPDENGIGEIRVKGPNVMLGYYEMPELTNEVLKDGWFYTGDLGYLDKDGFLYISGRSKSMIVLKNGKKIFPEEIEMVVNRLELVEESMAYGIPEKEDKNDVRLGIKVVYNQDVIKEKYSDKSEEELKEIVWEQIKEVNQTFPRYKHIQHLIVSHEELIKTTTKKVKRQEEMKKIVLEAE